MYCFQGIDLARILLVVQYGAPKSLCTYAQRFGRGARDFLLKCITIMIVETKWLDEFGEIEKELPKKQGKEMLAHLREELLWMWNYINAEFCRRLIFLKYFKNLLIGTSAGNNGLADAASASNLDNEECCCDRCSRKTASPCCDLFHPKSISI